MTHPETNAPADIEGSNLIFVISQKRSGSTLLQRMFFRHPDVHTVSEPWLMLPPLYALHAEGHQADYEAYTVEFASLALKDFLNELPGGGADYDEGLRRMYGYLYSRALSGSGRRFFLDKTPGYYLVLPELRRVFPAARYVVLLRNPAAVMCSYLDTWVKEKWTGFARYRRDMLLGPRLMAEAIRAADPAPVVVHYEQLVSDPETEMRRLCESLDLAYTPDLLNYGDDRPKRKWRLGDPRRVDKLTRPDAAGAERWQMALADPQIWRLARDLVDLLGDDLLADLGYPAPALREVLARTRPALAGLTVSFDWLTTKAYFERPGYDRWLIRGLRFLHHHIGPQRPPD